MNPKKRFQSGAEIFDTYVPNFERDEEYQSSTEQSEFVDSMLRNFRKNVESRISKSKQRRKPAENR